MQTYYTVLNCIAEPIGVTEGSMLASRALRDDNESTTVAELASVL
jgi:hypothetical protein